MTIGFYYHIPIVQNDNRIYVPSYLGVFIDALAQEVQTLYLFLHEAVESGVREADYALNAQNTQWISLGKKTPAWHRSIFCGRIVQPILNKAMALDVLLVRSPSPLAPCFANFPEFASKLAYLVVGDYGKGVSMLPNQSFRDKLVRYYTRWNDLVFKKALKGQLVLVNSRVLYNDLLHLTDRIFEIKTTTLSQDDLYLKIDTCQDAVVRLLYTGRYDMAKGLAELVEALKRLSVKGQAVELHLVGWEDHKEKPVALALQALASRLNVADRLFFHGRKKVGAELNAHYRKGDLYVLPSYQEGFPRTIWEAMANSCPVIATRVGSIPHYLEHEHNALLIEPGSVDAIVAAIKRMIEDGDLRRKLIRNGFELAQTNTLERQTKHLIKILEDHFRP